MSAAATARPRPTRTARLIKAEQATLADAENPDDRCRRASARELAGRDFHRPAAATARAASSAAGRGGGAHAPDEWLLIDSSNPKVPGSTSRRFLRRFPLRHREVAGRGR